jgi:hypothetical protein
MKIIITERQQRLLELNNSIRRRLHKADEFINNLDPKEVCDNWRENEVFSYVRDSLNIMTHECIRDDDDYDEAFKYLSNKYEKRIKKFFYDSLC